MSRRGPSSNAAQGAAGRQRNKHQGLVPWSLSFFLLPHQGQRWSKVGGRGTDRKWEGEAGLSITFYALTSFLWLQQEELRKQRG